MYPYCRHLRELDLRDLGDLLDRLQDNKFKKVAKQFWAGDLARFRHVFTDTPVKYRVGRLDIKKILLSIGDVLTQQAPLLEGLSEPSSSDVVSSALPLWASRLSHLRELEFWDGKALADETLRNLVHAHCRNLSELRFHHSTGDDADHNLAALINGMPENTLTRFENISSSGIGAETLLALNRHGRSLTSLKLGLDEDGILALKYLQACTQLRTLAITALRPSIDLKATQNDVFLEIVEWLKQCDLLNDVTFDGLISAPDLALPILLNKKVSLRDLQIHAKEGSLYVVKDHHDFHRALGQQHGLRSLWLRADPETISRDDQEILIDSFCHLPKLEELNLVRISDYFSDQQITTLAEHLTNLTHLTVAGYGTSDAVWDSLARLDKLKTLTFGGITTFTADGLLHFISQLGPGNAELAITVDNADPDSMITDEVQDKVRDAIIAKVGGRFEYQPLRGKQQRRQLCMNATDNVPDPNVPEFDDSGSD